VEPVRPTELDDGTAAQKAISPAASALETTASVDDEAALRALGEEAFFRYPTQLAEFAPVGVGSRAEATSYGLWIDDGRNQVGGLVRVELAGGRTGLAMTCATCHARANGSALLVGDGSDTFDLGRLIADATGAIPGSASPFLAWGPGRVDVTTTEGTASERIPDLRPVKWLTHLQQEATVAYRDRTALAIRLETLVITSQQYLVRPPRLLAWALAAYVESLATSLPPAPSDARGEAVFAVNCQGCHVPPAFTGPPVPLGVVGTDPAIGQSPERGTGMYRVPSLHGVGTRGLLFHDASLASLDAFLDPSRTAATFTDGTRPGAVMGHPFGLSLDDGDRAALLAYLKQL
jgi:mono/diheme cytochrome c family protein